MPIPHSFIIVKGQPKALLIEKIDLVEHGVYAIKYRRITGRFFDPLKMADMIIMNGIKTL
jgi:hypothetical protein